MFGSNISIGSIMVSVFIFEPKTEGHHTVYLRLCYEALSVCFDQMTICTDFTASQTIKEFSPYVKKGVVRLCTAGLTKKEANAFALHHSEGFDYLFIPYLDDMIESIAIHSVNADLRKMPKVGGIIMGIRDTRWIKRKLLRKQFLAPPKWIVARLLLRVFFSPKYSAPIILNQDSSMEYMKRMLPQMSDSCCVAYDPWIIKPDQSLDFVRSRYSIPQDKFVFIHIGSSGERKGFDDLLAAFERLKKSGYNESLFLLRVGNNQKFTSETKNRLYRLVQTGNACVVNEYIASNEFSNLIASADCVVLPYRYHAGPSGVLSAAIGAKVGVIASDYGFIGRAVRSWKCGILYKHNSVDGLVRAMRFFYEQECDFSVSEELHQSLSPSEFKRKISKAYVRELQSV